MKPIQERGVNEARDSDEAELWSMPLALKEKRRSKRGLDSWRIGLGFVSDESSGGSLGPRFPTRPTRRGEGGRGRSSQGQSVVLQWKGTCRGECGRKGGRGQRRT